MTDLRQAAQQALEALLLPTMKTQQMLIQRDEAIIALRRALEQQAEPVEGNTLLKAFLASAKEAGVTHLQQAEPKCWCHKCNENRLVNNIPFSMTRMILCPTCGNKRCPKASDHRLGCTDSNAAGQPGSAYPALPQQQAEPVAKYSDIVSDGGLDPRNKFDIAPPQQAESVQETEAFGFVTVRRLSRRFENHHDQYQFYPADQIPYLDNVDECHTVYTAPPQRKPLTVKEINALPEANGYWPIGMNDRILRLIRAAEAAHGIKEGT